MLAKKAPILINRSTQKKNTKWTNACITNAQLCHVPKKNNYTVRSGTQHTYYSAHAYTYFSI